MADKSLQLPLAIGLFGDWGTGKSFFMNLVKKAISEITKTARMADDTSSTYLPRIAQIEFNAWHYTDTNLWASMAARIYEGLMEELAGPRKSVNADARARLRTDIRSSKIQIEAAETERKNAIEQQAKALETLDRVTLEKAEAKNKLGKKLIEIFKNDERRRVMIKKLEDIAEKLGFSKSIQSEQDVNDLIVEFEGLASGAGAVWSRFRQFFKTGLSAACFLAFSALVLGIVFNLDDLLTWAFQDLWDLPGVVDWVSDRVSAPIAESLVTLGAAVTWISAQLKRASDGLAKAQDLRTDIRDLMNLTTEDNGPLAGAKKELACASAAVEKAEQEIKETEYRLEEVARELQRINAGGLVYDFLAEKLGDSVYTKNLGLISTIREDFNDLRHLMEDWRENAAIQELHNSDNVHSIERIVLYIDDLDRCHPDRVVEVLQAVHLLLAYDLFIVVVAVDARWLEQSLYRKYAPELFMAVNENYTSVKPGVFNEFSPHNYLEKIFQIPFTVPRMAPEGFEELMIHLAGEILPPDTMPKQTAKVEPINEGQLVAGDDPQVGTPEDPEPQLMPVLAPKQKSQPQLDFKPAAPVPALLPEESRCLGCMYALIKTPRLAKRLVNLYRLIRIHSMEDAATSTNFMDSKEKPFVAVALMLAINIACPEVSPALFRAIRNKPPAELLYPSAPPGSWHFEEILAELIVYLAHIDDDNSKLVVEYIGPLCDKIDTVTLETFVDDLSQTARSLEQVDLDAKTISIQTFRDWAAEVERFSFNWKSK